jgi:hypothetical protein
VLEYKTLRACPGNILARLAARLLGAAGGDPGTPAAHKNFLHIVSTATKMPKTRNRENRRAIITIIRQH